MRISWICITLVCCLAFFTAGISNTQTNKLDPEKTFLGDPQQRTKLLLLGSFHFKDAGLDGYKPKFDIDILSPERQREVEEVVSRLSQFRPTKIGLEVQKEKEGLINERYSNYLKGEYELPSNEIYQLGFRLAKSSGVKRLDAIDVKGRAYDPEPDLKTFAGQNGQQQLLESPWNKRFEALYQHDDELKTKQKLWEHLLYLNSEERIRIGHGHYLIGEFEVGKEDQYPGVDSVTGWWYNRNLRIFANLVRMAQSSNDRILVLIGAGHLPILRHAGQCSPQFQVVEVKEFLKPS
jgi:Family of unknown function (DUF5694)